MSSNLCTPSAVELKLQKELREKIENEIRRRGLSIEGLAGELELLPSGADVLLKRETWNMETALRIAACLGITVEFKLSSQP